MGLRDLSRLTIAFGPTTNLKLTKRVYLSQQALLIMTSSLCMIDLEHRFWTMLGKDIIAVYLHMVRREVESLIR